MSIHRSIPGLKRRHGPHLPLDICSLGQGVSAVDQTTSARASKERHPLHGVRELPIPFSLIVDEALELLPYSVKGGELSVGWEDENVLRWIQSLTI